MNAELQSKLTEILSAIQTGVGKAADFTMEQVPDIAWQYVMYGRAVYTVGFVVSLAITAVVTIWLIRAIRDEQGQLCECAFPAALIALPLSVVGTAMLFPTTMLVWFAPKVWLLKEIARLLK